ncbi:hypothetical protein [Hymenobacter persicinus]|uniref:Uncharacterized protein n=1 Tax=Hymenobacter persicinus TaxID=2025506 RepID=A0A4Q5LF49_9BACT|nr:hypothetical protein [Hymenobacter persicinus]RYU81266.1 hypothetical protein EWM57_06730 [Hymenobacter persicinus]
MAYSGIYIDTSFSHFVPAEIKGEPIGRASTTPTEASTLTTIYLQRYGCLPRGSSEITHIEHQGGAWTVGFQGIPRIAIFLNVLSIMENDLLPLDKDCSFDVVFNFQKDDQLIMTSASPYYIPNGNTYSNILTYLERTQHMCE